MKQQGIVIEQKGEELTVQCRRSSACEKCKGCSSENACLKIKVTGDAQVGDEVVVAMPQGQIAKASLLAYGLPLIGLLLGLILGSVIGKSDGMAALGAALGLGFSGLLLVIIDKKIKKKVQWAPTLVEVLEKAEI